MILCARGGCTLTTERKYCSRRCAAIARLCAGWTPQAALLRPDVRALACRLGSVAATRVKRQLRAKRILVRLQPVLRSAFFKRCDPEMKAGFLAVLAQGYRIGVADGYQRGYHAKETPRLKRRQKGEAA